MNILFLTMIRFGDGSGHGVYRDLVRKFRNEGHEVYVVYPIERRLHTPTNLMESNGMHILGVRALNVTKTNVVEKGLGQALIEPLFKHAIKRYFSRVRFDIIMYSTPPITLLKPVKWARRHNPQAITYLILKDIFPQNAVDIGMLSTRGVGGVLYRWFRMKERELYRISDWIGCMSPANVRYVIEHNPGLRAGKVEICPNSMEIPVCGGAAHTRGDVARRVSTDVRLKYGLPTDRPIFFYGGNLGKPQGIPFLVECLEANRYREDCHFVIVGNGVDYPLVKRWYDDVRPLNVTVMQILPKEEYDRLAASCDVGLVFLDYRFSIPNYPSRLLACQMARKPVLVCTDRNCDMGEIAEANGYGIWCPSNSVEAFADAVDRMLASDIKKMGELGYKFFLENYTVEHSYKAIMNHFY